MAAKPRAAPIKPWFKRAAAGTRAVAVGIAHGFRSGLEAKNGKHLETLGVQVEFESLKIPYVVPEKGHKYTPDFPLPNGIIVETKGLFENNDRAKHVLVKAQYPELDIRLVFTRASTPIRKGSPTTYAMWCEANGIKYAEKLIPEEWLLEPGPKRKPREVIKDGPNGYLKTLSVPLPVPPKG